ncbi:substrate-binding domain-containing protein [Mesorhizobium escarrei]|nr:substrate-binding domain-containing protein [Mesorhizobium escarrei]
MKVGLLISRSGPAGLWGPSCDTGAMLAVAEINAAGGVLGRQVELVIADAGWSETEAIMAAGTLVDIDGVHAVVGMHPSNVRDAIRRRLAGSVPYVYTPQYEGGERNPYTVATGGTDDEMLGPGIAWLSEKRKARRFFLVGNDYVWPRRAHQCAREIVHAAGGKIVGEAFPSFGLGNHREILDQIRKARPDVVVMALLGSEAASFNRAFSKAGLAAGILRFGLAIDESVLYAIGAEHSENLYVALNYFSGVQSAANDRFLETYHDCFGEYAPPVNQACQSCYDGVNVVANLARSIGRWDAASLARSFRRPVARSAVRSTLLKTPMGPTLKVHLAAAEGIEFKIVASH